MEKKPYLIILTSLISFCFVLPAHSQSGRISPPLIQHLYFDGADSVSKDSSWKQLSNNVIGHQSYTVKKGDTLGSISNRFFGTTTRWREIASANGISDPSKLTVGQTLFIPTTKQPTGGGTVYRQSSQFVSSPVQTYQQSIPTSTLPSLPLAPVSRDSDLMISGSAPLPKVLLPGEESPDKIVKRNMVTLNGLTGLVHTFASYPLADNTFSTAFAVSWNKITKREGERLRNGEDADYWEFPIILTYAGEGFEVAFKMPFESYDVYAPITYNFRDGKDSGMGDTALRFKFSSDNDNMATSLGLGAIFPTSDIKIGNTETDNAWEVFAGLSTKKENAGNIHVNGGYQAGGGNTAQEGFFLNVGFEYDPNNFFTFMGEVNFYNRVNSGKSTDLTLGLRYHVKEDMSLTLASPISLSNDMFFGYDYRLLGMLQYHY